MVQSDKNSSQFLREISRVTMTIRNLFVIVCLLQTSLVLSQDTSCFNNNVDITGNDMNGLLENKFNSAVECQSFCSGVDGANFFNWASTDFFDPHYHLNCQCKDAIQFSTPTTGVISGPNDCSESGCCDTIYIDSTGALADSPQSHVIGSYVKQFITGDLDTPIYRQLNSPYSYLYFMRDLDLWYIGETAGVNLGYAYNDGNNFCPQDLGNEWYYYDWGGTGTWAPDPLTTAQCTAHENPSSPSTSTPKPTVGGTSSTTTKGNLGQSTNKPTVTTSASTTNGGTVESCISGPACYACSTVAWYGDDIYCCSVHCNSGWIAIDDSQIPLCTCGL